MESRKEFPAILSDIDGVIYAGSHNLVGNSTNTIKKILKPYENSDMQIPFIFVTNGGGAVEKDRAMQLNKYLGLLENP